MYDPTSVGGGGVFGVAGDEQLEVVRAAEAEGLSAKLYGSEEEALEAFDRGSVDAVLSVREIDGLLEVRALAPESGLGTTRTVVQIRRVLGRLERSERRERSTSLESSPLEIPEGGGSSPFFGFTYTVLVPLLMFLPVFISGSIASDSITEGFERGTLELLRVSPVSEVEIVEGKMAAYGSVAVLQAGAWLLLLSLNGVEVVSPLWIMSVVAAFSAIAVVLGTVVGLHFRDRRRAQLVYSMAVLPLFGLSVLVADPFNAVAKFGIGSAASETVLYAAGYALVALLLVGAARLHLSRWDWG